MSYGQSKIGEPWRGYYITAYGIAVKHGFVGTEEEWLESLTGAPGESVELGFNDESNMLQWKLPSEEEWHDLISIETLQAEVVSKALATAEQAATDAQTAQSAAETAQAKAEEAQAKAETAGAGVETHAQAAIDAQAAAERAQSAAESAQSRAETAATDAQVHETLAGNNATAAAQSAANARSAATDADNSAGDAQASATKAGEHAGEAADHAKEAESWAVGGTGTRDGENTNNAKYWCENAAAAAGGGVTSFNGRGGAVSPQSGDYTAGMVGADPAGTAASAVSAHNTNTSAHEDIRKELAGKEASGAAAAVQSNLDTHAGNTTLHTTETEKNAWSAKSGKAVAFTVTLSASGWSEKVQTVSDARFLADGYAYSVAPDSGSFSAYGEAMIYADNVTTAGQMCFHCSEAPAAALTVNILRTEASA